MIDRREFMRVSGGLCLAFTVGGSAVAAKRTAGARVTPPVALTAYLTIARDGSIKLWSPTSEMGQGTHTAHAAIIADELGVDIARISVETAVPADPFRRRSNPSAPASMASGGSWGVRFWVVPLRKAAAQAREMLIAAAAAKFGTPAADLHVIDGFVERFRDGKRLPIGELAAAAAQLPPPAEPALRAVTQRRFVGKELRRIDIPAKVSGQAVYALDFKRPNMLFACARMAPVAGADVAKLDGAAARKIPGVRDIVQFPGGAAVVANNSWAAMRGAAELAIEFTSTPGDGLNSAAIDTALRAGLDAAEAAPSRNEDFAAVASRAAKTVTADYSVPYLAHAPLEPFSCTVEFAADGSVDLWTMSQAQDRVLNTTSAALGLPKEKIRLHTLYLGGGFGRRLMDDGYAPAVLTARAVHEKFRAPVKFFWDRATEFSQGYVRPTYKARLTAALDADNKLLGVSMRTASPSLARSQAPPSAPPVDVKTFVDGAAVQNLGDVRYKFGAFRVEYAFRHNHFPLAPWRSVGATQNAFFIEVFLDEVARAAGKDPVEFRRELLAHDPRGLAVVNLAAEKAGWGTPLPPGRARGFAYFECYGSLCAQVAEVSWINDGPRVHRVVCVLDCGEVVTPNGTRAQIEGGVIQGLSSGLFEALHLADGAAVERNFDSYRLLRIAEAPVVESYFLESKETMGGVGEPPVPPATPAVANALAVLRGVPVRDLPIVKMS
jgi:isoquinoline 1-oxidoreductase beta subunit